MPVPPVEVDEVHDVAGREPIDEVAGRAADDERQADARQPLFGAAASRVQRERRQRRRWRRSTSTTVLNGKSAAFSKPNAAP